MFGRCAENPKLEMRNAKLRGRRDFILLVIKPEMEEMDRILGVIDGRGIFLIGIEGRGEGR